LSSSGDRLRSVLHEDALRTALFAGVTTLASGVAAALISGAWQKALLCLSALAALILLTVLFSSGWWHLRERGERDFGDAQDEDAARRGLKDHERDVREVITQAAGRTGSAGGQQADVSALVEMLRKQIAAAQPSLLGLLLVHDLHPSRPRVIAQAGSFDQSLLDNPTELNEWIDSSRGCVYPGRVDIAGKCYRLLGVADSPFREYGQAEIQRAATCVQALMVAHLVAGSDEDIGGVEHG
jgi:hypothetical protein